MGLQLNEVLNVFICIGISYVLSIIFIPKIIRFSISKRLFDDDEIERKVHSKLTPRFGGVAIFIGFIVSILFLIFHFITIDDTRKYFTLFICAILMFIMGLIDDVSNLKARNKFLIQFLVALFLTVNKIIYIDNFLGLFGIYELPNIIAFLVTIFSVIFIINSYNLIDGIDGLSVTIALFSMTLFIVVFYMSNNFTNIYICLPIMGALIGFLNFNKSPAKIFMGDSGTMFIGFILAFMTIEVSIMPIDAIGTKNPIFAIGTIFYPVVDTMRVFIKRILKGKSPFSPDQDHLHHHLLKAKLNHTQVTLTIFFISIFVTGVLYLFRKNITVSFFIFIGFGMLISQLIVYLKKIKK